MSKVILEIASRKIDQNSFKINIHESQSFMETFRREVIQNKCSLKVRQTNMKAIVTEPLSS